ncbi:MAG TPA: hypothetical protein VIR98_02095 [Candidatus Paceibacterota bacterium]|jgi:hypothetical protein
MKAFKWFFEKKYRVLYAGKENVLVCRRWKRMPESPQEFTDRNAVICGNCGNFIMPRDVICLMPVEKEVDELRPGVIVRKEQGRRMLVGCFHGECALKGLVVRGRLLENREIHFFE